MSKKIWGVIEVIGAAVRGKVQKMIQKESKLSNLKGIKQEMIEQLNLNNIYTREDLADLSTDELLEMIELPKEEAGKIIMDAREPWFEETKD